MTMYWHGSAIEWALLSRVAIERQVAVEKEVAGERQGRAMSVNRGGIWPGTVLRETVVWWLRLNRKAREPGKRDLRRNAIPVNRGGISHDIAPALSTVGVWLE